MERLLVLILVFGGIAIGGVIVRTLAQRRRAKAIASLRLDPSDGGQARIISFCGPSCDACDRQKAVLADLEQARPGRVSVDFHDAAADYDYARQFGLVLVPTTVVIAGDGAIAAINSGYAPRTTLESQLDAA